MCPSLAEMSLERITVRERIAPEITASLFSNYRSSADAVMELVDNAVDSRLAKSQLVVAITVHPTSLIVMTEGGEGMGVQELERNYLRWGGSPKRGRHLLGQYGQGGKAAIGHLGQRFSVEASRPDEEIAWRFLDDDYRDRSRLKTYEVVPVPKRTDVGIGYVRIRIDGVDKRIDQRRLVQRLANTYRPLLDSESLRITLNNQPVKAEPLRTTERKDISLNAAGGRLRGWLGLADADQASAGWTPGLRCYKLGRLITEGEFFGHPGPAQLPAMVRLIGEIDIPQVRLTMNKSDFDRDSDQWVDVEARIHRAMAPIVRRLARDTEEPPPANAVRVAEQVRRLLSQALRLTDRPDIFSGLTLANPETAQRRAASDELPFDAQPGPEPELREPKVPRIGDASKATRGRGFGSIVIRPLDPSVRSTTVVEDATRVVVINSRYPLFKERRGDIWYQLETAAREVCQSADAANVAEYEARVNEIILTATALRTRRRRTRALRGAQLTLLKG